MCGEDNGLTLQGLAQKLEAMTRRLEVVERENASLRDEVATQRGPGTHEEVVEEPAAAHEPEGRMSRSRLLSRAGAAAAGLVVAGAITQRDIREAKAAIVSGTTNLSGRGAVEGTNESTSGYGVYGNSKYIGVYGRGNNYGLRGWSSVIGVYGTGSNGIGVYGIGTTGVYGQTSTEGRAGVFGSHSGANGYGVIGEGNGIYAGVRGRHIDGTGEGVRGEGTPGVRGESSRGPGVVGIAGAAGIAGVYGTTQGSTNAGVSGVNSNGYGGRFEGGKAQLLLIPGGTVGRPTTGAHRQGELYMDSAGALFVCTAAGTPGTWRRVTTTAT
jgi:hypothetical protein